MKVAIMQPYLFPYIGYFQLINAVDTFVFYDDVNYIKKGWINRNRILSNNNEDYLFTVPLIEASQNKMINEIDVFTSEKWKIKFLKNIKVTYFKAPYFDSAFELITRVLNEKYKTISDLAILSIIQVSKELELSTSFRKSSIDFFQTKELKGVERLLEICKIINAEVYINPIGGQELYDKEQFLNNGVDFFFLKSKNIQYKQFDNEYIPWLSIIDLLMFNSKEEIKSYLTNYTFL